VRDERGRAGLEVAEVDVGRLGPGVGAVVVGEAGDEVGRRAEERDAAAVGADAGERAVAAAEAGVADARAGERERVGRRVEDPDLLGQPVGRAVDELVAAGERDAPAVGADRGRRAGGAGAGPAANGDA
jgi:hypothetical protein